MHGAQSTFLAGLPPNRRVSPSPCCHSPNSPMACWPQGAWGIPVASCAPHRADGVEGVRGWGDAISFWVGRRRQRTEAGRLWHANLIVSSSTRTKQQTCRFCICQEGPKQNAYILPCQQHRMRDLPCMVPRAPSWPACPPNRRVSPSPCCHSPNSPMACWPQGAWGIPVASCAPHRADGVEGVRGWGDAISFWVGRRRQRTEAGRLWHANHILSSSTRTKQQTCRFCICQEGPKQNAYILPCQQHRMRDLPCMVPRAPSWPACPPNRRVSPSPCCHSPNSPMACWPQGAWGIPVASCAPHRADGVEGVRGWGDAISFWVGQRRQRTEATAVELSQTTRNALACQPHPVKLNVN